MNKNIPANVLTDHIAEALKRVAAAAEPELRRSGWMSLLADEIGVSDQTVNNWVYGKNPPPGGVLVALFAHLGDDFLNDVLSVIDRRAVPIDAGEVDTSQLADIQADADAISAKIQKALDGAKKREDAA